jgi:protein tyrosine phosphatase (PTP) superfamily phosphohydrolase (DUF442 family)
MTRLRPLRWALRLVVVALVLPGLWFAQRWRSGNTGTVVPGRIYRSGQLNADQLADFCRQNAIRTVLNLRGPNPQANWYRAERAAALSSGATQLDVALASDHWLSHAQVRALLDVLDTVEPPVLIHCQWGAERTGLVSAFAQLLRPGVSLADARREFSLHYLFVPWKDGKVMLGHVDAYATWLRDQGDSHDPVRFRRWLREEYTPGQPSREVWPYDPYPLVVATRPAGTEPAPVAAGSRASIPR